MRTSALLRMPPLYINLRLRSRTWQHYRELIAQTRLGAAEIVHLQAERLKRLLRHCHEQVPFYRESLDLAWSRNNDLADPIAILRALPILTKDDVRSGFMALISRELTERKWFYNASGGSTGDPLRLIQDLKFRDSQRATRMLFDNWTGYHIGMRKVIFWGSERDMRGETGAPTRVYRWLANELWINAFAVGADAHLPIARQIREARPAQVLAYVDSLYHLSRDVDPTELAGAPKPGAIISSAGTLHPWMRKHIESVFEAPVFNRYGSREAGDMACECHLHRGLHVVLPQHVLEIVDDEGNPCPPGVEGHVLVTPLTNLAMPLLRYRIGDIAAWAEEPCPCGLSWPLLEHVHGRSSDVLVAADGTRVHGEYFTHLFYGLDWVRRFQLVQETVDRLVLSIVQVPGAQMRIVEADTERLLPEIRRVMGPNCRVVIRFVETIPPLPSGKHRFTVSLLSD
jgi:phenylacetate-CoA ligase